ncbi:MAG: cation-transporting P-type ATPase [Nitrospirota bacterium]
MKIHNLTEEEVFHSLLTSPGGLSEQEASQRFLEYGPNEIKEVRKRPLYKRFVSQFTHFFAILLWIAAVLCFLSDHLRPGEGMGSLGVAILGVIFLNAFFTFIQEYRAEKAVEALKKLLPFNVRVTRNNAVREIPVREVVPGDIVFLSEGDKVPADARVVESTRMIVNNAPLTGESESMPRNPEPFGGEFLQSPNIVFAGTHVVSGSGKAVVFATAMSTEFGKIAHLTSAVEPGLSPLQKEMLRVTRIIAAIAFVTGSFFFAVGTLMERGFWHNMIFAIGITIANVPEGLLPTVTLALAMGSQRMAKKKALIKTLTSVETLGAVTVICTDKTGTLTQNRMEVREIWTPDNEETSVRKLMEIGYLCNNAVFEDGTYKGDPTDVAILKRSLPYAGGARPERISEIPFDSDRKRMTTLHSRDGSLLVATKGAVETVLPLCKAVFLRDGAQRMTDGLEELLLHKYDEMTNKGLRVISLAFAQKKAAESSVSPVVDNTVESDMTFVGLFGLEDPPREEVPEAIRRCREAGIKVIMITGDASRTGVAIAKQIGLARHDPLVVEGNLLDKMTDSGLREAIRSPELVFARMTPRHKMRIVSALKEEGERVAVTGDGVNDAPALKKADIGIAMGIAGTDVAKEAADIILLDDNFATIVNAVEEGRAIFENIRKFITYIFAHLTPEAIPYIFFALLRIPLPLTVMQILAIDLGTETIPALALGTEKPEADTMRRPPRRTEKGLIDRSVLFQGYVFIGLISTGGALFAYFYVLFSGGWQWGMSLPAGHPLAREAATGTFLGIVMMQVGSVFACRSFKDSVFRSGFLSNRLLMYGIIFEIALAAVIVYLPLGNRIFDTAPLPVGIWVLLIPFAVIIVATEEIRKALWRRFN